MELRPLALNLIEENADIALMRIADSWRDLDRRVTMRMDAPSMSVRMTFHMVMEMSRRQFMQTVAQQRNRPIKGDEAGCQQFSAGLLHSKPKMHAECKCNPFANSSRIRIGPQLNFTES